MLRAMVIVLLSSTYYMGAHDIIPYKKKIHIFIRNYRSVHVKKTKFEFTKFFSWFFFSFKFGFFFLNKIRIWFFSSEKIQIHKEKKTKFKFGFFSEIKKNQIWKFGFFFLEKKSKFEGEKKTKKKI